MSEKVCPRCGAMYEDLKSTTCPQCFAKLLVVDEATAEELRAAREEVEQTPEFQAAKVEDDERFREQSFGACLSVAVIGLVTVALVVVLIVVAVHRYNRPQLRHVSSGQVNVQATPDPRTLLPVAGALLDDVMPPTLPPYARRSREQEVTLPGTTTPVYHAVYAPPGGGPLDLYAIPGGRPTGEQNEYALGVSLAARSGGQARPVMPFATEHWRYIAVGSQPERLREALGTYFRQLGR